MEALLTPAIWAQQGYYRQLGMRDRILNLSLMVAAVLTLLWRQVVGVQERASFACKRRPAVVSGNHSFSTSYERTILDISRRIV